MPSTKTRKKIRITDDEKIAYEGFRRRITDTSGMVRFYPTPKQIKVREELFKKRYE